LKQWIFMILKNAISIVSLTFAIFAFLLSISALGGVVFHIITRMV